MKNEAEHRGNDGNGKLAVVLFNLGGPDSLEAVRPFLFNLFNDPAILNLSAPLRYWLAKLISWRRAPVTRDIYTRLGGHSPLLEQTRAQAKALETELNDRGYDATCMIAMRYWKPFTSEAVAAVKKLNPDTLVLLPLYPQYSGTTAGSSFQEWDKEAAEADLGKDGEKVCCYPTLPGFVDVLADFTRSAVAEARIIGTPRVLFSAHGLPKQVIDDGDPYQKQVEATIAAVKDAIGDPDLDYSICYQSRIGKMEWIGPSIKSEIARAGQDERPLIVVPVSFVSEHSETLVELDLEYFQYARHVGVPYYNRTPTVGRMPKFISGLADLVQQTIEGHGDEICPIAVDQDICDWCKTCPHGNSQDDVDAKR